MSSNTAAPLAGLLEPYTHHLATCHTAATAKTYHTTMHRFCRWAGPDATLAALNPAHVRRFLDALQVSDRTQANARKNMHRFCMWAMEAGHLATDPMLELMNRVHVVAATEPHRAFAYTPDTTLMALLEPYYAHLATRYTKETRHSYMCDVRRFCRWARPGATAATLNTATISRFLDTLGDDTRPSAIRIRGSVHHFCMWAVEARYLPTDPMLDLFTRPRTAAPTPVASSTSTSTHDLASYTAYIECLNAIHDLPTAIDGFLAQRRWKGVADGSIGLYHRWLHLWYDWQCSTGRSLDLAAIGAADMVGFLDYLHHEHHAHQDNPHRNTAPAPGLSILSRQSCWRILRAFWNFLNDESLLTTDQARIFKRGFVPCPRNTDPNGLAHDKAIDATMVMQLIAACGAPVDELAARNQAIVWMLHETGLRVTELCRLTEATIDQERMTGRVRGKGNKWGHFFWGERTAAALARYLQLRSGTAEAESPLFRSCGSRSAGHPITSDAVRHMMWALATTAGVTLPPGAPVHGFRTGFAQELLDVGVDSLDLKQLMRHEQLDTTMIYVKRHPAKLRKVYQRAAHARRYIKQGATP